MEYKTREEWLTAAAGELAKMLPELPKSIKVSVGFPRRARNAIGQCFDGKLSEDGSTYHIFVSPEVKEPKQVLATLLHELVHAAVGCECGHRGAFGKLIRQLGFANAKSTGVGWSAELEQKLVGVLEKLGPWPSVAINPSERKKQTTRMLLYQCPDCGVKIRHAGTKLRAQCLTCREVFELQAPA